MTQLPGEFVNVDLEVESTLAVAPLIEALDRRKKGAHVLHQERRGRRHFVSFELYDLPRSADEAVNQLAGLVEKLPPDARRIWDKASFRSFDIGVIGGMALPALAVELSARSVNRVAALGAKVVVTVYPPGGTGDAPTPAG